MALRPAVLYPGQGPAHQLFTEIVPSRGHALRTPDDWFVYHQPQIPHRFWAQLAHNQQCLLVNITGCFVYRKPKIPRFRGHAQRQVQPGRAARLRAAERRSGLSVEQRKDQGEERHDKPVVSAVR